MQIAGQRQHGGRRKRLERIGLHNKGWARLAAITRQGDRDEIAAAHFHSSPSSAKLASSQRSIAASSPSGSRATATAFDALVDQFAQQRANRLVLLAGNPGECGLQRRLDAKGESALADDVVRGMPAHLVMRIVMYYAIQTAAACNQCIPSL